MADTSLIIGNGNWAVKETSLLGYNIIQSKYVPIEMTVVRVTTATRINSAGLIEVVPINLLTYSEQFNNAIWTTNTAVTANNINSPLGIQNADKIQAITTSAFIYITTTAQNSTIYTVSVYAKAGTSTILELDTCNNTRGSYFNLSNGTIAQTINGTASIESVGNGWYRCSVTETSNDTIQEAVLFVCDAAGSNAVTSGKNLYLWGAQINQGSLKEYFPTTDRFNIPRVDYSTGTASLLVEPLRTNLALRSEEFDNIYWTKVTTNITSNTAIAPDGTMTADTFTPTSAVITSAIQRTFTGITGSHTISVYARVDTGTKSFRFFRFNVTDGNVSSPTFTATTTWQRFTWNTSPTITSSWFIANASTDLVPFFVWGAQLEAGSNATSYIPTVAATVTRNADVISKTGVSSLIGQTEGTIYAEINITTFNNGGILAISDGTSANRIQMYKFTDNKIYCERISATQSGSTIIVSSALSVGTYKVAFAYQSGNSYLYINGAQVGATSVATFTFGSMGKVNIGSRFDDSAILNDRIQLATLFPTRLTNAQLATLTTI